MTRTTPHILQALTDHGGFISAQELHRALRGSGSRIGLSTIYRALAALAADGDVDALTIAGSVTLYRRCGTTGAHHHHLICRTCGRTIEVSAPPVEGWIEGIAHQHGYTDTSHQVEIYGLCATCSDSTRSDPTSPPASR